MPIAIRTYFFSWSEPVHKWQLREGINYGETFVMCVQSATSAHRGKEYDPITQSVTAADLPPSAGHTLCPPTTKG